MLLFALDRSRAQFAWKVGGLDAAALNRPHPPSAMTLGGLIKHMAGVEERNTALAITGGRPRRRGTSTTLRRHPDFEWRTAADDSPAVELYDLWQTAVERSKESRSRPRSPMAGSTGRPNTSTIPAPVRFESAPVAFDLHDEYARHVGHADLLREAVDGLVARFTALVGGHLRAAAFQVGDRLGVARAAILVGPRVEVPAGHAVEFGGGGGPQRCVGTFAGDAPNSRTATLIIAVRTPVALRLNSVRTRSRASWGGRDLGPGPPLNDPLFASLISEDELKSVIASGRHGTLMPAWASGAGGPLTDEQVAVLVKGIKQQKWESAADSKTQKVYPSAPPLTAASGTKGTAKAGEKVYAVACAACHGDQGEGVHEVAGAINDKAFLSLCSDEQMRRYIITGRPDLGMPNFAEDESRGSDFKPLTSQQVSDLVALIAQWREKLTRNDDKHGKAKLKANRRRSSAAANIPDVVHGAGEHRCGGAGSNTGSRLSGGSDRGTKRRTVDFAAGRYADFPKGKRG